jgi:uncharacterized RDD family membrane protein YckC
MSDGRGEHRRGLRPLSWIADRTVDALPVEGIVEQIDVNAVAARIDIDELLAGVDLDAALDRVDVNRLLDRVDADALLDRVDPNALLDRVDPNALLDRVDPNALLDRVDPNALLDRVDANRLLDRVDPDRLLDRVDPDRLLDRVDPDRLMSRMDVSALVERAGVREIVAESTGAVAETFLDTLRRQLVALDTLVENAVYRLTRRDPATRPASPRGLLAKDQEVLQGRWQVSGKYAGPVTRVAAFGIDLLLIFWSFTLGSAGVAWMLNTVGIEVPNDWELGAWLLVLWGFLYLFASILITGRTAGKGLIGLRVLEHDGDPVRGRDAALRTIALPLSFAFFGLGILVSLISPRRLTFHDMVARTCEVYDWGDRPAELPAPLTAWITKRTQ